MNWQLGAACIELFGNAALVVSLAVGGARVWPSVGLRRLAAVAAVYAATNVFYAAAYVGRTTNSWEIWDTPVEAGVYHVQIVSMWALLLTGILSLVNARD